jgi:hypothetical protein
MNDTNVTQLLGTRSGRQDVSREIVDAQVRPLPL